MAAIKQLENGDLAEYGRHAAEYGSAFDSLEWLSIYGGNVRIYAILDDGGNIIGGFHLYRAKKFGMSFFLDPPFCPAIGPFLKIGECSYTTSLENWKKTLTAMAQLLDQIPYSIISLSLDKKIADMQPFIWKKFKVSPRFTYVLDLDNSIDDIWKGMTNERRKNIKKSIKDGFAVQKTVDFNKLRPLAVKTFERQGEKKNSHYIDRILHEYARTGNCFAFLTTRDGSPAAFTFCIYDSNTAFYLLGGHIDNCHHGAGTLALWESIKYAKEMGLKNFDFEGSMLPNIERYIRGFGGRMVTYYRVSKAGLLLEMALKLYRRELF
ncbi:MAG: GNAT family N-acetyltransferase [Nitrospiraceae bacterium]|nr:GNAT family N-acetyltransferase [Nitrospiraceae bacterium]